MDFNILAIILILIVAFLAGMEGILDQFQFHQPIIACSLIGVATGHIKECVMLGGVLQLMALGWANVGAAVAPDAALASVASAIIFAKNNFKDQGTVIGTAVALATAGLVLTMVVRTLSVVIVHQAVIQGALGALPEWFTMGMSIGGGFVVAVGYAMVINLMATKEVWPFFFLGFALAPVKELTLIATGIIGVAAAIIYLNVTNNKGNGGGDGGASSSGDPLGDILNDY